MRAVKKPLIRRIAVLNINLHLKGGNVIQPDESYSLQWQAPNNFRKLSFGILPKNNVLG